MGNANIRKAGKNATKSTILSLAAVLFFNIAAVSTCQAQAALLVLVFGDKIATEKFHTSIDAGLNFSSMPGLENSKTRYGLYFGLGTFVKLNDKWAFTPEFKPLSQRGAREVDPLMAYPSIRDAKYSIMANYIDVPLMVQYKIRPEIFVAAGPQISFLTAATQETKGTLIGTGNDITASEDFRKSFNPMYFCFPVEIGFSLPEVIPGQGMDIKIRYCIGINDVIKDQGYGSSSLSSLQVFASFPFIKKATKE
ncbi:MAG: porin family protein [Bacteroidota bacterium]